MAHKPFHPAGAAGTNGGVVVKDEIVSLIDPETGEELGRRQYAGGYEPLYTGKRLLDLFKNHGLWYTGKPWKQSVEFTVTNRQQFVIEGEVKYQEATRPLSWEAHRYYSDPPTWEIGIDLPPDHRMTGDIGLQVALGQAIYEHLEEEHEQWTLTVSNLFSDIPAELPFRVNRLGEYPFRYLENVYGRVWESSGHKWVYGPYGEILPGPLTDGIVPDEVVKEMVGEEIFNLMPENEREMFYGEAAIYAHAKQLERVLAGDTGGDEYRERLLRSVLSGKPVSLRPLGYEKVNYTTFAPVWQRLGDDQWQVGLESAGKIEVYETSNVKVAFLKARDLYQEWAEAESRSAAKGMVRSKQPTAGSRRLCP